MNETDLSEWDRLPNGNIETSPVVGWAVAAFPLNVMLRLEMLMEDGRIGSVQVHIPAPRVAELTEALLRTAKRALASDGQGRS